MTIIERIKGFYKSVTFYIMLLDYCFSALFASVSFCCRMRNIPIIIITMLIALLGKSVVLAQDLLAEEDFPQQSPRSLWEVNPFIYLNAVVGKTDIGESDLEQGGHDPARSGFSVPSLAIGLDAYYGEYFGAFAEGVLFWDKEDGWDAEVEELYLKANMLPYGFDLQAGRFLATVGSQNNVHNHEWAFVDNQLSDVRFLGEDGLITDGVEVAWRPRGRWNDQIIASFGEPVGHDDDDEEEGEHNEGAEESLWDDNVFTLRYRANFQFGYNHSLKTGVSYVQGKNVADKTARLYGADTQYTWVDDIYLDLKFTWANEMMFRDIDTSEGSFNEFAYSSRATYSWDPRYSVGLRYDYLEGVEEIGLAERHRISPAISHEFEYREYPVTLRLQYNFDYSEIENESRNDHSIWLQLNYQWGSGSLTHKH